MKFKGKAMALALVSVMTMGMLSACGTNEAVKTSSAPASQEAAKSGAEKTFTYGTMAYNVENADAGLNPHKDYSGWSCVRYGVGETLFKYSDAMELEPWLATDYEMIDPTTWKINLRDDVTFSSGRKLDGQAVKECLEDLIAVHDRAPEDLKIAEITADGQSITIKTTEDVPAFINYLSDPYGAIIDMGFGVTEDENVAGTGPYVAEAVSGTEISLVKNENYWGGEVKVDRVIVKSITDGDTMTMALQSGEIDATQGLPYASLPLFQDNADYNISSCETSRSFFAQMNYLTEALQDINVRKAIAMGIDREGFTKVLLNGNGAPAVGPFPESFTFGDAKVTAPKYNIEEGKKLLEQSGWSDTDGDGYVDKNGENLTIRWLTYPSRQELPLLAESVQASLKELGIDVVVNSTANHKDFLTSGEWDIYASAFVTAPTGDPEYFFTTHCLSTSAKNRGNYYSEKLEGLEAQMKAEFDTAKRADLAVQMTQTILDDGSFIFASHLKMSLVTKSNVTGFAAHPSDYYEITADLDIAK